MINVAVVGTGSMGKNHARVYAQLENVNLVAVSDLNKETGKAVADQCGCKYYSDFKEMLETETIDAVSVVVPTKFHKDVAVECIKRGKNVLVEKPIALNADEANEVIRAAEENKIKLMVGHIERFNPAVQKLREIIKNGTLGEITSVICRRVGPFPPRIQDANVVVDLAVHDIDVCTYLLDKKPKKVFATAGRALNSTREDYADMILNYEDGLSAFVQVNWITPTKIRKVNITGTRGYAELNYITQELVIYKTDLVKPENFDEIVKMGTPKAETVEIVKTEPLIAELNSFINCVNGSKCESSGKDALNSLIIANSAIDSYGKNENMEINYE
ncbi:MAG: Gfo/Idh/MocA family oxidoreductase [Candidatus Aenigmatarchaeota archaeon]